MLNSVKSRAAEITHVEFTGLLRLRVTDLIIAVVIDAIKGVLGGDADSLIVILGRFRDGGSIASLLADPHGRLVGFVSIMVAASVTEVSFAAILSGLDIECSIAVALTVLNSVIDEAVFDSEVVSISGASSTDEAFSRITSIIFDVLFAGAVALGGRSPFGGHRRQENIIRVAGHNFSFIGFGDGDKRGEDFDVAEGALDFVSSDSYQTIGD